MIGSTIWQESFPSDGDSTNQPPKNVRAMEYNMEEFMISCVTTYCDLAKVQRSSLPHVSTPFLVDSSVDDGVGGPK
eukprot:12931162-Prorocentrum_lima.AAC.1